MGLVALALLSDPWSSPPGAAEDYPWSIQFGLIRPDIRASIEYNGELVVAGNFGHPTRSIMRWNGFAWVPFGGGIEGTIYALAIYEGNLVAAGSFGATVSGVQVSNIALWNGFSWQALGAGVDGIGVRALEVFDGRLYVGGFFSTAGGVPANRIASWDGSSWRALDTGVSADPSSSGVYALETYSSKLIVGGHFTRAGAVSAKHVAAWDESSLWSAVGTFPNRSVHSLTIHQGDLIAGSRISSSKDVGDFITRWDGTSWNPVGTETLEYSYDTVFGLTDFDGELYAGGDFTISGTPAMNRVARFDGTAWYPLESGISGTVYTMAPFQGQLLVGGNFTAAGGLVAGGLALWNGASWDVPETMLFGNLGLDASARAGIVYGGDVVVGGAFVTADWTTVEHVARWDGAEWHALGAGFDGEVRVLHLHNGELIAGGSFTLADGMPANHVARWNGGGWTPLGDGFDNVVLSLTSFGGALVAGGLFTTSGFLPVNHVARWDGTSWSFLGTGLPGSVDALSVFENDLIAGGGFDFISGTTGVSRIARWDGTQWLPMGAGFNDGVHALQLFNGALHAGGDFTSSAGGVLNHMARWDGAQWKPLGLGLVSGSANVLHIYNGNLIVGGSFLEARDVGVGLAASRIVRWDGAAWSALEGGTNGTVYALVANGTDLFVGGAFTQVGSVSSNYIARWTDADLTPTDAGEERDAATRLPQVLLWQNVPNPFNPFTRIRYRLPRRTHVSLSIFDVRGRLVRSLVHASRNRGDHDVVWDGTDTSGRSLSSGTYFCRLRTSVHQESRRLVLLR